MVDMTLTPDGPEHVAADVVSLFSGAGGLDAGLERAGWSTAVATDIDADAIETLVRTQRSELSVRGQDGRRHLEGARILKADIRELRAADLRHVLRGRPFSSYHAPMIAVRDRPRPQ